MEEKISSLERQIVELTEKVDKVYISSEKMRKYFLWTLVTTVVVVVVPLLLLPFAVSSLLGNINTALNF